MCDYEQKTAYESRLSLVGSEMCIRKRAWGTKIIKNRKIRKLDPGESLGDESGKNETNKNIKSWGEPESENKKNEKIRFRGEPGGRK